MGDRVFERTNRSTKTPVYYNEESNVAIAITNRIGLWNFKHILDMLSDKHRDRLLETIKFNTDLAVRLIVHRDGKLWVTIHHGFVYDDYAAKAADRFNDYVVDHYREESYTRAKYKEIFSGTAIIIKDN